eukprot:8461969-Pyramimonas_sp.AAC.1
MYWLLGLIQVPPRGSRGGLDPLLSGVRAVPCARLPSERRPSHSLNLENKKGNLGSSALVRRRPSVRRAGPFRESRRERARALESHGRQPRPRFCFCVCFSYRPRLHQTPPSKVPAQLRLVAVAAEDGALPQVSLHVVREVRHFAFALYVCPGGRALRCSLLRRRLLRLSANAHATRPPPS